MGEGKSFTQVTWNYRVTLVTYIKKSMVNAVALDPTASLVASAGDDGVLLL